MGMGRVNIAVGELGMGCMEGLADMGIIMTLPSNNNNRNNNTATNTQITNHHQISQTLTPTPTQAHTQQTQIQMQVTCQTWEVHLVVKEVIRH